MIQLVVKRRAGLFIGYEKLILYIHSLIMVTMNTDQIRKAGVVLSFILLLGITAHAGENGVNWLSMEEAQEKVQEEPRMVFVDVYTDWCGWCRRMTNETYAHPVIAAYLNDNFYPVKLNAEQKEPIVFQGNVFENENIGERRASHSFAIALLQGRMSYPSVAFFNEQMQLVTAIPGFRPPARMEALLAFFHTGTYLESDDLDSYTQEFRGRIDEE